MTIEHHSFVTRNDMVSYEYCIQLIAQTGKEIGDSEMDMKLCLDQRNRRMLEKISTENSEPHVFETNYWCMTTCIEEHLDDVSM